MAGVQLFSFGNVALADKPGPNTSKFENLGSPYKPVEVLKIKAFSKTVKFFWVVMQCG
jgi:hypothetical protein